MQEPRLSHSRPQSHGSCQSSFSGNVGPLSRTAAPSPDWHAVLISLSQYDSRQDDTSVSRQQCTALDDLAALYEIRVSNPPFECTPIQRGQPGGFRQLQVVTKNPGYNSEARSYIIQHIPRERHPRIPHSVIICQLLTSTRFVKHRFDIRCQVLSQRLREESRCSSARAPSWQYWA